MLLETFKKTERSSVLIGLILKATQNSNPNLWKGKETKQHQSIWPSHEEQ